MKNIIHEPYERAGRKIVAKYQTGLNVIHFHILEDWKALIARLLMNKFISTQTFNSER